MEGSKRRFLERQATYQVSVTNPGTAPAKQVELVVQLPTGLKFVSANNAGSLRRGRRRIVRWRLEELPANETGSVELVTHAGRGRPACDQTPRHGPEGPGRGKGASGGDRRHCGRPRSKWPTLPIRSRVGGDTIYEVHVTNQGSKGASNVQLDVLFPPELKPAAAEGPTRYSLDAGRVSLRRAGPGGPEGRGDLSHPCKGPTARRSPRPLPTGDRRHANACHQGREHSRVCGQLAKQPLWSERVVASVTATGEMSLTGPVRRKAARDRAGVSVLIFDYRGYGRSEGEPCETGVLSDARAARSWLAHREGAAEGQIVLMGRSLGGAVAVDLAATDGTRTGARKHFHIDSRRGPKHVSVVAGSPVGEDPTQFGREDR